MATQAERVWSESRLLGDRLYVMEVLKVDDLYPWLVITLPWRTGPGELIASGREETEEEAKRQAIAALDTAVDATIG